MTAALVYSAMTPLGMAIGLGAQGGLVSQTLLFGVVYKYYLRGSAC